MIPGLVCTSILVGLITWIITHGVLTTGWKRAADDRNLKLCEGTLYRVTSTDILYFHKNYGMFQTDSMTGWRKEVAGFVKNHENEDMHGVIVDKPTDTTNPVYKGCKVKVSKHNRIIWEVVEHTGVSKGRLVLLVKDTKERG